MDKIARLSERRKRQRGRLGLYPEMSFHMLPDYLHRAEMRELRAARNVASMPFPFNGMIGITSDIDRSNRSLFNAYTTQMNGEFGLDFGDSIWLSNNRVSDNPGLAFFGPELRADPDCVKARRDIELDIYELADGVHSGLIDHWHSFSTRGPRAFVFKGGVIGGMLARDQIKYRRPPLPEKLEPLFTPRPAPIFAGSLLVPKSASGTPKQISLRFGVSSGRKWRSRRLKYVLLPETDAEMFPILKKDFGEWNYFLFTIDPGVASNTPVPEAYLIGEATVDWSENVSSLRDKVPILTLYNIHSRLLLDRIAYLHDEFGVRLSLSSTHALWHLIKNTRLDAGKGIADLIANTRFRAEHAEEELSALPTMLDAQGIYFTTMGDDPESFARIFPEILEKYGVKHFRISGMWSPAEHDSPEEMLALTDDLIHPLKRRDGGVLMNARSTMSDIPDKYADYEGERRRKTTARSFSARMEHLLGWFDKAPKHPPVGSHGQMGRGVFFYTHVGNWEEQQTIPNPYFDPAVLGEWRNRHYGTNLVGGDGRTRLWFARASVLADFALMNQIMLEAAEVDPETNTVDISSFDDPLLGIRLPECSAQLYGQTFFLKNASAARVTLDGKRIWDIQCNPPMTGRAQTSVTIATCGIRKVVFDELDPMSPSLHRPEFSATAGGVSWAWMRNADQSPSRQFGRITLTGDGGSSPAFLGSLRLDLRNFHLPAAQQFFYSMRRKGPEVLFGIEWEVASGGRFFAGDAELYRDLKACTAHYLFDEQWRETDLWRRYVVPLYGMRWLRRAQATSSLPNHELKSMRLIIKGSLGTHVDIDEVEFGKPRTTRPVCGEGVAIVGGKVGEGITLVRLSAHDEVSATPEMSFKPDGFLGFRFRAVPFGAYRISWQGAGGRKGEFDIEVKCDRFDLRLDT